MSISLEDFGVVTRHEQPAISLDDFSLVIQHNQPELLAEMLEALELENDDPAETDRLLAQLIRFCHTFQAPKELLILILDRWDENSQITHEQEQLGDDHLSTFTLCFTFPDLEEGDLEYMARSITAISYSEIATDLISHVPGILAVQALEKATTIYRMNQEGEAEEIVNLINVAEEKIHPYIHAYLIGLYEGMSSHADPPPWLRAAPSDFNFNYQDYTVPLIKINIPTDIEEQIQILLSGYEQERPGLFDLPSTAELPAEIDPVARAEELRRLSSEQREELVTQMLVSRERLKLAEDEELSRRLGPANPAARSFLDDSNESLDIVCRAYGGCRMLLCNCLSNQDPDEEGETDWFTGHCQQCLKKISHRSHALREPRIHGGWLGCYCSLQCALEYIEDDNIEEESQRKVWFETTALGLELQGIYAPE